MRAALVLTCWFFACSRSFCPAQANDNINYLVPYEEVEETYVEWPQDSASQTLLQTRPPDSIPPIKMTLWTTAIDFRHPLLHLLLGIVRRLDRELLFFQPRYFLADGVERGCRYIDPTTGETQETEWDVNSNALFEDCQQNCTNHGRYCAASIPADPALASKIDGADIVEETLRRFCIWVVYGKQAGNNVLNFFDYVNDLLFEQCDAPFGAECTTSIMENSDIGDEYINECMSHSGGVEDDRMNDYLEDQMEIQHESTITDIAPTLKIGEHIYTGVQSTADIFRAVCADYPPGNQPMACDFCKDCDNVRYCLWSLTCDGTTFDTYAAKKLELGFVPVLGSDESFPELEQDGNTGVESGSTPETTTSYPINDNDNELSATNFTSGPAVTSAPTTAPTATATTSAPSIGSTNGFPQSTAKPSQPESAVPTNGNGNANNHHKNGNNEKAHKEAKATLIRGVLLGLAIGLGISAMYGCKDWQARLILHEMTQEDRNKGSGGGLDGTFVGASSYFQNSFTPSKASLENNEVEEYSSDRVLPEGNAEDGILL